MGLIPFLKNREERLASRLKRGASSLPTGLVLGGFVSIVFLLLITFCLVFGTANSRGSAESALRATHSSWAEHWISTQSERLDWLERRATVIERKAYERISSALSATALKTKAAEPEGFISGLSRTCIDGLGRVAFFVTANLRLWLAVLLIASFLGFTSITVYRGPDLLGATGNGRAFYSGIRASLDNLTPEGIPDVHIPGLACPKFVPQKIAKSSSLALVLKRFNAENPTNLALVSILLAYPKHPAYVATKGSESALSKSFSGSNLPEHAAEILATCLEIHHSLSQSDAKNSLLDQVSHVGIKASAPMLREGSPPKLNSKDYASTLKVSLLRSLTPALYEALADIPPAVLATTILSIEAGKTMAYAAAGESFSRVSNYPQLCSRSVLHAIPTLAKDYNYATRSTIRRALVYAARSGAFGPVQFPVDLTLETRALRQWTELLLACPHELQVVTDQVELIGKLWNYHQEWLERFMLGTLAFKANEQSDMFATETNLLFVPAALIIDQLKRVIPREELGKMEALASIVLKRQAEAAQAEDAPEGYVPTDALRVPATIDPREAKALSSLHASSEADIRDWSTIRMVLDHFGWLGKRVGNDNVPASYLFCSVGRPREGMRDQNALGLVGKRGMICLRGSHLAEAWGRNWIEKFPIFDEVRIAANQNDFEKLLQGIREENNPEENFEAS